MRKFGLLLTKELKEMLTLQTLLPMIICALIFMFLGQFFSDMNGESDMNNGGAYTIIDQDGSELSGELISAVAAQGFSASIISDPAQADGDYIAIPQGFEAQVLSGESGRIELHDQVTSLSMMSNMQARTTAVVGALMNDALSAMLYEQEDSSYDFNFVANPVMQDSVTHINGRSAHISPEMLMAITMQQSIVLPIAVFMLAVFGSQMVAAATANEKIDKTLETLLAAPIPRLSVLAAKMLSAGIVSLIIAAVYLVAFSSYMGSVAGGAGGVEMSGMGEAMSALGLQMGVMEYLYLGLNMFATLLICLCVATILGALASDVKSAQTVITPLMITLMLPYLATIFTDVASLSPLPRWILYLIPFTHTYTATTNLMLGRVGTMFAGLGYQVVFLAVCLFVAVRVFSSDRLFTMKLNLSRRNKKQLPAQDS